MALKAEILIPAAATLGEGSLWDGRRQRLLWVDILGQKVYIYDPETDTNIGYDTGSDVGTVVPRTPGKAAGGADTLVVALRRGLGALNLKTGAVEIFANPEAAKPKNRFNDGKCDPAGRFWAGTMGPHGTAEAALYRLDVDHSLHTMITGVGTSNGLVWSADHKLFYYIDTPTGRVDVFDYDLETGAIANRRPAVTPDPNAEATGGRPDGMTIDADGMLWVAMWGGATVVRYNPKTGAVLEKIDVPGARHSSSCAFGGKDMQTLFITSAKTGVKPEQLAEQPNAGHLFAVRIANTKGLPGLEYRG